MKKYIYHVTDTVNFQLILKEGLRATDGKIFIFTEKIAAPSIALNQCGLFDYALLKIDPEGITSKLVPDKVAELTAKSQYYIEQELVQPKYIDLVNCYKINLKNSGK